MRALDAVGKFKLHVVAQEIEAELVIRAVSHVGPVGRAALFIFQTVDDDTDRHAQ